MILLVVTILLTIITNLSVIYYYAKLVRSFVILKVHYSIGFKMILGHEYFRNKIIFSFVPVLNIVNLYMNIMEFHVENRAELIADRIYIEKFR